MGYRGGLNVTQVNPKRGADIFLGVDQSIPNNAATEIAFDSETEDTSAYHAVGASSIVVPAGLAGFYVVAAQARFAVNATGARELRILVNGAVQAGVGTDSPADAGWRGSAVVAVPLVAGDVITADLFQNSGAALSTQEPNATRLQVYRVAA